MSIRILEKSSWLLIPGLILLLAACSRIQGVDSVDTLTQPAAATATSIPVETATSVPIPTDTATPTPEPPIPILSVSDQELTDDGRLIIDRVFAIEPGWIVIQTEQDGEVGEVLAYESVSEGENEDIVVTIDPLKASPILYAMLHFDAGQSGEFEFPGPDRPVLVESELLADTFAVDIQVHIPSLTVSDQELAEGDPVIIDEVVAADAGWIVLHLDEQGEPGGMVGYAPVTKGEQGDVIVSYNWLEATPVLHALLYNDAGEVGKLEEPEIDQPVVLDDQSIAATLRIILPPEVYVVDQPILNGTIIVEEATSYGQGWLVVYQDDEGGLGKIIGYASLEDGVNENIAISVTQSAVTPVMHLVLHQDLEDIGEFGFPRTDPAVLYQDRLPNPFSIRTDAGNFLVTRDQELSAENTITVPLVVVDENTWVTIRTGELEEEGEIAGMNLLPPGFHQDVVVEIDPDLVSPTMVVILHLDTGQLGEFEYPDGVDIPLQRNRNVIQAPILILPDNTGQ